MEQVILLRGALDKSLDGYGYGYDGYGYGGYGYGDGYGYGYGEYWSATIPWFVAKWPTGRRVRYEHLLSVGTKIVFWCSNANGAPANGGSGVMAEPGAIHTVPGPLNLCHSGTLHGTLMPTKWKGTRWWIVALHGEVIGDDEKFGCLNREILGECL